MELSKHISKINLSLVFLLLFLAKISYFSPSYADSIVFIVLGFVYGFNSYLKTKASILSENEFRKKIISEIEKMKTEISRNKLENKNIFSNKR